jgi:membrane protein involved in colicin uptake
MRKLTATLIGLLVSLEAGAQAYYLCQDPNTGKKVAQDSPCQPGREIRSYAPVSPAELKAREEASRAHKREFERLHPGTYAPEEYMTAEELAVHREKLKEREAERAAERRRIEEEAAVRDAARRAAQAEQRAAEAERAAREAQARATEAERAAAEAAAQSSRSVLLAPRLPSPPQRDHAKERERKEPPTTVPRPPCIDTPSKRCP